jgi:hypothetical protein
LIRIAGTPPAECTGTATAPVAAPGNLCIWETYGSGVGVIDVFDFVSGNYATTNVWGTSLLERPAVSGSLFYGGGTWVATAPAGTAVHAARKADRSHLPLQAP